MTTDLDSLLEKYKYNNVPLEETIRQVMKKFDYSSLTETKKQEVAYILCDYKNAYVSRYRTVKDLENLLYMEGTLGVDTEIHNALVSSYNGQVDFIPTQDQELDSIVAYMKKSFFLFPKSHFRLVKGPTVGEYKLEGSASGLLTPQHGSLPVTLKPIPAGTNYALHYGLEIGRYIDFWIDNNSKGKSKIKSKPIYVPSQRITSKYSLVEIMR